MTSAETPARSRVALAVVRDEKTRGTRAGRGANNFQAELAGEVVAESGGAHLGDGEAAGGDDESGGAKFAGIAADDEFGVAANFADFGVQENLDARRRGIPLRAWR